MTTHKTDHRNEFWCPVRGTFFGPANRTPRRYWPLIGETCIDRIGQMDESEVTYHGWSNRIAALLKWAIRAKERETLRWILIQQINAARKHRANC